MLTNHEEIKNWLHQQEIKNHYTIRPDGIVDVIGSVDLRNFKGTTLPIQFGKVDGNFFCNGTRITSLVGCPQYVGGGFYCYDTNITSLVGCPEYVGGNFYSDGTKIKSLSGIDKIIKESNRGFVCVDNVTHLLGLLLIKGITFFNIDGGGPIDQIMNKYRGTGDFLSAQDELIDAGFIDQARL